MRYKCSNIYIDNMVTNMREKLAINIEPKK